VITSWHINRELGAFVIRLIAIFYDDEVLASSEAETSDLDSKLNMNKDNLND